MSRTAIVGRSAPGGFSEVASIASDASASGSAGYGTFMILTETSQGWLPAGYGHYTLTGEVELMTLPNWPVGGSDQTLITDTLATAEQEHVRFVNLQFTDVVGLVKSVTIPLEQFPDAITH